MKLIHVSVLELIVESVKQAKTIQQQQEHVYPLAAVHLRLTLRMQPAKVMCSPWCSLASESSTVSIS